MARTETQEITLHPPELYRFDRQAEYVDALDAIGPAEIQRFHDDGYLAVRRAFSKPETSAALQGLLDLIDGKNPKFDGIQFEAKAAARLNELTSEERQDAVRKLMHFVNFDERLKAIAEHKALLRVVSTLMGGKTPKLFQDMALLKPPRIGREKPWHQDCAYFNLPLTTTVVGVWIALDEATPENGCMHIIPGSHREGPVIHFQRRDWQLCDRDVSVERDVVVPLAPGGILLFHGLLHHGTPHNNSPQRRRAIQYHYKPDDCVDVTKEERMKHFGSEGKDVEC